MSSLLPEGIESLTDCPHHLADAISKGLLFLSFMEELPDDERPPRRIWLNPGKLKEHFAAVKKRREEKYGGSGNEIEDAKQNAAAKALIAE